MAMSPWTCSACQKTFTSLAGFDAHRVGEYVDTAPKYGRRCLDDAEFSAKGYHQNTGDPRWRENLSDDDRARLEKWRASKA